jgi:hypothetical protein
MPILNNNGKQIAPCIVSKVRHALKVPNRYRSNDKKCSKFYWDNTCDIIGVYSVYVGPLFWDVDPPVKQAINVRA